MDVYLGRSFPDTGENPQIIGVPESIQNAALSLAIAFWKEADAPMGTAGSDSFFGELSVAESTRQMLERAPGLVGFRVSWGVG